MKNIPTFRMFSVFLYFEDTTEIEIFQDLLQKIFEKILENVF